MAFPANPSPGDSYTDEYGTVWVYAGAVNGWYRQYVSNSNDITYTTGGNATAAGTAGQIQFTDGTNLAASADLTWDDTGKELGVGGDINLDDGGTYATTLQLITPTANRTISFPDATGTVGLVRGSSGQLVYNNAGAYAGASSTSVGATGNITLSLAGAASTPPVSLTGTWFSGGTSTTTKPQLLIEPTGTTSTAWSTNGTGLGVNGASGFTGRLFDFQVNGSSQAVLTGAGQLGLGTSSPSTKLHVSGSASVNTSAITAAALSIGPDSAAGGVPVLAFTSANTSSQRIDFGDPESGSIGRITYSHANNSLTFRTNASDALHINSAGLVGVGTTSPTALLDVSADVLRLRTAKTPASATDTGNAGDICWDANYVYVCTATNTWKRSALSSW